MRPGIEAVGELKCAGGTSRERCARARKVGGGRASLASQEGQWTPSHLLLLEKHQSLIYCPWTDCIVRLVCRIQ